MLPRISCSQTKKKISNHNGPFVPLSYHTYYSDLRITTKTFDTVLDYSSAIY